MAKIPQVKQWFVLILSYFSLIPLLEIACNLNRVLATIGRYHSRNRLGWSKFLSRRIAGHHKRRWYVLIRLLD